MGAARRGAVRSVLGAAALVATLALSGCNGLGGTGDGGYVPGRSNVVSFDASERGGPVSISGTSLDGEELDLSSFRGRVVVVNVWASWCGPCRSEASMLVRASTQTDAAFVGIDVRDTDANGRSFQREFSVPYPSLSDQGGESLLKFGKHSPSQAMPSTAILDRDGRVAALINGAIPSTTTLVEVVEEVAAEDRPAQPGQDTPTDG